MNKLNRKIFFKTLCLGGFIGFFANKLKAKSSETLIFQDYPKEVLDAIRNKESFLYNLNAESSYVGDRNIGFVLTYDDGGRIKNCDIDKIRGALYYLEGGELIATKFKKELVEKTIEELKEIYDIIKEADEKYVIGTPGWHCKFCEYRLACHFSRCKK